ncbi:cytochrome P450 [Actinoplanes sp. N902-109]|uniref:cytochrome P450 n=1 Tax=Actinoplanes sp. (strain N902-109) TaxID=649831 RepID=UPI000329486E|nr:cytochrome P450 [Actinoplanes sp. N902-109]AGL14342.1 cytochrome P450 [Actinoplanes sp. N902-109]
MSVCEIDVSDPAVLGDPLTAYAQAREAGPVARLVTPGFGFMWAVTRYDDAKTMLADERFELTANTFLRPAVPEHCRRYMRTMTELEPPEHARLRRLVSPAFTARRAAAFRPRIERIVDALLAELPATGEVELVGAVARPLPIDVICELVGIPERDRAAWRGYGAAISAVDLEAYSAAIPAIIQDAAGAVARRTAEPGDDLLSELIGISAGDAGRLSEVELVTLVWHLVLAGQTPANLLANAVEALLRHPGELAALRADPSLLPAAVEELTRWCSPQPLSLPRFPREDVELGGVRIGRGEPVVAALACANRDPRAFADPDRLDLRRSGPAHLGYAHGPHFCLGAALARVEIEVALAALLHRFPAMSVVTAEHVPDPGTWRLNRLVVSL